MCQLEYSEYYRQTTCGVDYECDKYCDCGVFWLYSCSNCSRLGCSCNFMFLGLLGRQQKIYWGIVKNTEEDTSAHTHTKNTTKHLSYTHSPLYFYIHHFIRMFCTIQRFFSIPTIVFNLININILDLILWNINMHWMGWILIWLIKYFQNILVTFITRRISTRIKRDNIR